MMPFLASARALRRHATAMAMTATLAAPLAAATTGQAVAATLPAATTATDTAASTDSVLSADGTLTAAPARRTPKKLHTAAAGAGGAGAFLHMTYPNYQDIAAAPFVVLQQHQYAMVPKIHAMHPGVKIYFYSNITAASRGAGSGSFQPSVITWPELSAHPQWLLKDANGTPVWWRDYDYLAPFDPGVPEVQTRAISNINAEMSAHGWDGVLLDDVNVDVDGHDWTGKPVNYTGGSTFTATDAFLKKVAPAIRATGKEVAINMQSRWNFWQPQIDAWAPLVDVINLEHCTSWTDATSKPANYFETGLDTTWRMNEMKAIQAKGTRVWCHDYGSTGDTRAQAFHRAVFLMAWDGVSQSATMWTPSPVTDTYRTRVGTTDLGLPTSAMETLQTNVYRRSFAQGTLYLNAGTTAATVSTPQGSLTLQPLEATVR